MSTMIERYIYDVIRKLPEAEREDVKRELNSSILDMLPENPTDDEVRKALEGLGSPSKLAEGYRQHSRCLISQSIYDEYINALKWVLPLAGTICLIIGIVVGFRQAMTESMNTVKWFQVLMSNCISLCADGLLQAFFWTTIGFAIADRVSRKTDERWTIEKLPDELPPAKGAISLSDSIIETVLSAMFTALGVCVLSGKIPFVMSLKAIDSRMVALFNTQAAEPCIPFVIIAGAIAVIAGIAKIAYRRHNMTVFCLTIANSLAGLFAVLYILTRPNLWSDSFIAFLGELGKRYSAGNFLSACASDGARPLSIVVGSIAIAVFAVLIALSIVKTIKARKPESKR